MEDAGLMASLGCPVLIDVNGSILVAEGKVRTQLLDSL